MIHQSSIFKTVPKKAGFWRKPCNCQNDELEIDTSQSPKPGRAEMFKVEHKLTVTGNGRSFKEPKAVLALKGWNLAMREFGRILRFLVVNKMLV